MVTATTFKASNDSRVSSFLRPRKTSSTSTSKSTTTTSSPTSSTSTSRTFTSSSQNNTSRPKITQTFEGFNLGFQGITPSTSKEEQARIAASNRALADDAFRRRTSPDTRSFTSLSNAEQQQALSRFLTPNTSFKSSTTSIQNNGSNRSTSSIASQVTNAIPKTNPTGTAPAFSNPDRFNNFVVTRPQITGNSQIDKIFEGQRQTTILIAQEFQKRRNDALARGLTQAEANAEAKKFVGISKDLQNAVNTALQTDIIQQKAASIAAAEEQIRKVTSGEAQPETIQNLGDFVTNVKGTKIQQINIQTDADGADLSPRKTKLQLENALLTGSKFDDITFNIDVDERITSADNPTSKDQSLTVKDSLGNVTISSDRIGKFISPSALQVGLQESDPLSFLIGQLEISPELQKQSPLFGGSGGQVSQDLVSDTGLTPQNIIDGTAPTSGFDVGEQNGEVTIAKQGQQVFRGSREEAIEFITNLITSANAGNNEQLQAELANLRQTVSKGESISLLLEQVLGILAALSFSQGQPSAPSQGGSSSVDSTANVPANPLQGFFNFINAIIDSAISIVVPQK